MIRFRFKVRLNTSAKQNTFNGKEISSLKKPNKGKASALVLSDKSINVLTNKLVEVYSTVYTVFTHYSRKWRNNRCKYLQNPFQAKRPFPFLTTKFLTDFTRFRRSPHRLQRHHPLRDWSIRTCRSRVGPIRNPSVMFDFLNPKLLPKVSCDSPVTDGYEAENLISDKGTKRLLGFICYPSVRPPVELDFTLLCSTNLQYVVLNTTVGSHSCSGIELRVRTHPKSTNYIPVGKAFYDKPGVVFCTPQYFDSDLFDKSFHRAHFFRNSFRFLSNVSAIKVVIFRTNRSVPCLASVQAWATPGKFCSETTINTLHRLMDQAHSSTTETSDTFIIPQDFKDALTDEVMTIPMTLPSGNTIDRTTLDKHVRNEESFGRKPCDPFTGIKFTDTLKPVLNVALKGRLDTFISQNSFRKELQNLQRTIGRIATNTTTSKPAEQTETREKPDGIDDLEEALAAAKRSKGFVAFSEEEKCANSCVRCSKTIQSAYELPCKHYHCRECLLVTEGLRCSKCGSSFSAADVKRINL